MCTPDCKHGRRTVGDMIRCCGCATRFHDCVGIESEDDRGVWPCPECRLTSANIRSLVDTISNLLNLTESISNRLMGIRHGRLSGEGTCVIAPALCYNFAYFCQEYPCDFSTRDIVSIIESPESTWTLKNGCSDTEFWMQKLGLKLYIFCHSIWLSDCRPACWITQHTCLCNSHCSEFQLL